jgi:hypothetical protein
MFDAMDPVSLEWGQLCVALGAAFLFGAIYGRWRERHRLAKATTTASSGHRSSRIETHLAIYCCGIQMMWTQQVGDFRQYGVCFLKCVKCKREICIEEARKVAELDYQPVPSSSTAAANPLNAEG